MHPILLKLGPLTLYTYGAMMVLAFVTSTWLAAQAARRLPLAERAISAEQIADFSCVALLGGILGGRLFYILLRWKLFARAPQEMPAIWHGGLVWYGGFLGGVAAGRLYARAKGLSFLRVLDHFIPFLALGHAIGRIGCFLNGCCYGKPNVPPPQLLESAGLFALFALLRWLQRGSVRRYPGRLFGVYLSLYAVLRVGIEFLRGDQSVLWAGLTLQQLISLLAFVMGMGLILRRRMMDAP